MEEEIGLSFGLLQNLDNIIDYYDFYMILKVATSLSSLQMCIMRSWLVGYGSFRTIYCNRNDHGGANKILFVQQTKTVYLSLRDRFLSTCGANGAA